MQCCVAQFADIVRRDVGRHADRDARGAIGEEIGEIGRKHRRLLLAAIVVRAEIDGVLVDTLEQTRGNFRQPRFGVAFGGRIIAVDIAEIALAVDERVADGEVLSETRQRIVDRLIAVGMEIAHRVADDLGALAELTLRGEPELLHGIKDAPVHGLQAIAHVGKCAMHDGREGVGEIALFQRLAQIDWLDRPLRIRGCCPFSHRVCAYRIGKAGSRRLRPLRIAIRDGRGVCDGLPALQAGIIDEDLDLVVVPLIAVLPASNADTDIR
jgi:hypothetical protein